MDEIDRKVLRAHQEFPDLSMVDLGEKIGMSHGACWKRVKRLERDGVISGRAVLVDQKAIGLNATVIAHVRIESHKADALEAFERAARRHPEITVCFTMSGDADFLLRVVAADIEDYERILKDKLSNLPHVVAINSSFVLKRVKDTPTLPI
ncbi:MAG: Lrp/AsnC family transcriptional regulator [Pseudomonadota bacterium]